jgi:hypothetical protein
VFYCQADSITQTHKELVKNKLQNLLEEETNNKWLEESCDALN